MTTKEAREARLAAQLRANLRRRKVAPRTPEDESGAAPSDRNDS